MNHERQQWHTEAVIIRSKLSQLMAKECLGYVELERLYRQLEADRVEHDRFDEPIYKPANQIG